MTDILDSVRGDLLDLLDETAQGLYENQYLALLYQLKRDIQQRITRVYDGHRSRGAASQPITSSGA